MDACVTAAPRTPIAECEVSLPTPVADEEGVLRLRPRPTLVRAYKPMPGEPARLYELGIPVVETGDAFDLDVGQKVPLSMQRDSLPPRYLRQLRAHALTQRHPRA